MTNKRRSDKPPVIKTEEKARITALARSDPPSSRADWTLRLLSDKTVELGFVQQISHTEVGRILKKPTSTAAEKAMAYRANQRRIFGADGRCIIALQSAI